MELVSPQLYIYLYLTIVAFLTFIYVKNLKVYDCFAKRPRVAGSNNPAFWICLFFILFVGLRPVNIAFVDMVSYDQYYRNAVSNIFIFDENYENVLFDNLMYYMASVFSSSQLFFLLIATIYYGGMLVACMKIFPHNYLIPFLMFAGAFSTFNYATNGIKAGAAASIFLIALAYHDKRLISIPLVFVSLGFHHGMILVVATYFIATIVKKTRWFFWGWMVCAILSALHITYFQNLFGSFADEKGQSYLLVSGADGYMTGFRIDFILYSVVPVIIGYITIIKNKIHDEKYEFLLRNYLLTNSVWMLCMYASFTARIAYLSWFMYPIVLIYPFISVKCNLGTYKKAKSAVLYHLSFTLFMEFVFYNL